MPTPGYVFRDSGTTPPADGEFETEGKQLASKSPESPSSPPPSRRSQPSSPSPLQEKSSDSHKIAVADHDTKGAAQLAGKTSNVSDLGWRSPPKDVDTLVGKLSNEELWILVRRFNKQIYHLKAIPTVPPGGLDLNIADDDEFSPDKLRANVERLYMTVLIGLMSCGKFIARLRSWREPRRTAAACAIYFLAWLIGGLLPLSLSLLIVLILVPKSRPFLFPSAPIALVDGKTGGVQKPKAGVLGSHDSAIGAPENHQGEAVEQEAANLVNGIASVALASAAGRHDQGDPEDTQAETNIPDPTKMANAAADSKTSAQILYPVQEHDKTRQPMEDAIWTKMRPTMHAIGDIADGWERMANALAPTSPFPHTAQYQLAATIAPLLLISLFIKPAHVLNGSTLLSGLIFFSDPLQQRGIKFLNERIPDWPKYLQLRNTLFKGVPTNAQLTITLLRIGEANRAPLPPPPSADSPPPDEPAEIDKTALTDGGLDASHSEIDEAITADTQSHSGDTDSSSPAAKKSGAGAKIVSLFKPTAAAGVSTKLGTVDRVRATIGSDNAKEKLGVLPAKEDLAKCPREGPVAFQARYQGTKGAIYLDSTVSPALGPDRPASPCIYFTTAKTPLPPSTTTTTTSSSTNQSPHATGTQVDDHDRVPTTTTNTTNTNTNTTTTTPNNSSPQWIISIADISQVKKVGGLGWKGKMVVGWATDRAVRDGLDIVHRHTGRSYRVTALTQRNELFNRLVAMGDQVWESC